YESNGTYIFIVFNKGSKNGSIFDKSGKITHLSGFDGSKVTPFGPKHVRIHTPICTQVEKIKGNGQGRPFFSWQKSKMLHMLDL
ncbi:hypothetical protein PJO47_29470, partial [Mycobacterium kansasii]